MTNWIDEIANNNIATVRSFAGDMQWSSELGHSVRPGSCDDLLDVGTHCLKYPPN